jgi:hypothetical protein
MPRGLSTYHPHIGVIPLPIIASEYSEPSLRFAVKEAHSRHIRYSTIQTIAYQLYTKQKHAFNTRRNQPAPPAMGCVRCTSPISPVPSNPTDSTQELTNQLQLSVGRRRPLETEIPQRRLPRGPDTLLTGIPSWRHKDRGPGVYGEIRAEE